MKIFKEFREFAVRGNVVDMAVGIIIGGAFGKIVSSFVSDVIMPPLGLVIGGVNFIDLKWVMRDAVTNSAGVITTPAVSLNYGQFIQVVFDFLIVAFSIFMAIKAMNSFNKKEKEAPAAPAAPPVPTKEEVLLSEIRDILKNK